MSEFTPDPGERAEPPAIVIPLEMYARFRGEQGPKGDQGEQGEQGEPGEIRLIPMAQALVQQLVDGAAWSQNAVASLNKAVHTLRKVIIALVILFAVNGGVVGYLVYENITHTEASQLQAQVQGLEAYVQQYAKHGCSALGLLAAKPVPKPADPAANPSRETTYEFYEAVLYWERADRCKIVTG
jgi:hypothetical protein